MRRTHAVWLSVSLLLVVALSGCAKARAAKDPDPFLQPKGFDDLTGSVQGRVVDEEFVPLKDAIVGFIDPYQATKTDEAGFFEIGLLNAGKRNLYAIHLGHMAGAKRIDIKIHEATEVTFVLPVLPIEEPWIDIVQHRGQFDRGVNIDPIGPNLNASTHQWTLRDSPGAMEALHIDAIWSATNQLSGGLHLTFGLGGDASEDLFLDLTGQPPLRGSVDRLGIEGTWKKSKSVCVKIQCVLRWEATPATNITNLPVDIGVMVDQPFDVYVSHFYRMTMPAGYELNP